MTVISGRVASLLYAPGFEEPRSPFILPLPVQITHALHVHVLPDYHRDSFDRLIIAQARLENLPILTSDPEIGRYPVETIW